jgi:hypothetical protein
MVDCPLSGHHLWILLRAADQTLDVVVDADQRAVAIGAVHRNVVRVYSLCAYLMSTSHAW